MSKTHMVKIKIMYS